MAKAIKNAREMALLPYVTRITQQRGGRGDRGDRGAVAIVAIAVTAVTAAIAVPAATVARRGPPPRSGDRAGTDAVAAVGRHARPPAADGGEA